MPDLVPTSEGESSVASFTPVNWEVAWEQFGRRFPRMKHGAILLNYAFFNVFGWSILGVISSIRGLLPWWSWLLVFLSTTVVTQMFVNHFAGVGYRLQLNDLKTPHLRILFNRDNGDYVYPQQVVIPDGTPHGLIKDFLLFKVGITSTTADLVRLEIPSITIDGKNATSVYLHIADDRSYEKRETHLNANTDPVYWDVIAGSSNHDQFFLEHVKPNTGRALPAKLLEFTLTASGRDGRIPTRKLVKMFLDEKKVPQFELYDLP
jgi:hypothetical protein